jgi:hypothetical protein
MPRENSLSDSEGRSLTPDIESDAGSEMDIPAPVSPTYGPGQRPAFPPVIEPHGELPQSTFSIKSASRRSVRAHSEPAARPDMPPLDRFRSAAKKVMALHRSTPMIKRWQAGAEPGVDPRRASADFHYGDIKQDCVVEVMDYSSVRSMYGKMTNKEFVKIMEDPKASEPEPWTRVRWINIAGMSWDVMKAVSIKYSESIVAEIYRSN